MKSRVVVAVDAKDKNEAVAALKVMLNQVENQDYRGKVNETLEVEDERKNNT